MIYSKWRQVDTDVIEKEHFVVLNTKQWTAYSSQKLSVHNVNERFSEYCYKFKFI